MTSGASTVDNPSSASRTQAVFRCTFRGRRVVADGVGDRANGFAPRLCAAGDSWRAPWRWCRRLPAGLAPSAAALWYSVRKKKKKKRHSLSAGCSDYKQHCRSTAGYFLLLAMWVNVRSLRLERPTPRALHWRKETRSAVEARAR